MTINLNSEMKSSDTILVVIPDEEYSSFMIGIAKQLGEMGSGVCYVSLNKMVSALRESLQKNNVDLSRFFFIDGITKSLNIPTKKYGNCDYVENGCSALTRLCLSINAVLRKGKFKILLFDSVSTLLIYHDERTVIRCMQSILNQVKAYNCKAIVSALEQDTKKGLLKQMGMFVDTVI